MRYQHLSVADVMSEPPIPIRERETLAVASERMQASGTRHLPVVDQHGHLVGLVASRDLYRELAREEGRDLRVGEVMTAEVATVRPATPACEATLLLLERNSGALPVGADAGELVGMVTETDFVRLAHVVLGGDRLSSDDK